MLHVADVPAGMEFADSHVHYVPNKVVFFEAHRRAAQRKWYITHEGLMLVLSILGLVRELVTVGRSVSQLGCQLLTS
jgi:hypothetical protein